jgi:hypothetical protein
MSEAWAWLWSLVAAGIVAALALFSFVGTRRRRTVFVSYRRSDTAADVGPVVDLLVRRFGRRRVFRDVQSIGPGEPFRAAIVRTLRRCDAAVVLIGPTWASCRGEGGLPRLHEPGDFVRLEVTGALASGALVIPLLVRGAAVPAEAELPEHLRPLLERQAVALRGEPGAWAPPVLEAIAGAPLRRTPLFVLLGHAAVAAMLAVFTFAGGLDTKELVGALAIVGPPLAACAAGLALAHATADEPGRIRIVPASAVAIPLGFVAAIGAMVVLRAYNLGIDSPRSFQGWLLAAELAFAAYSGLVLASLRERSIE